MTELLRIWQGYIFEWGCSLLRRGFTIRLKRLKPRAPILGRPKISGVRTISSIFVSNYICIFVLVQRTFFTMPLTKDLCRTGVSNFFIRGHISYYTTVRGSDILRNVILSGYVTFYQIKKLFVN